VSDRPSLAALAPLFRYPERMPAFDGGPELAAFLEAAGSLDLAGLQSAYTATFDLAPLCSPYLGDHLFGDEHRDRARLMVGLRSRYGTVSGDLPDHIAEVLSFAHRFDEAEWRELGQLVLMPALRKMADALDGTTSPYRHLVAAATRILEENP